MKITGLRIMVLPLLGASVSLLGCGEDQAERMQMEKRMLVPAGSSDDFAAYMKKSFKLAGKNKTGYYFGLEPVFMLDGAVAADADTAGGGAAEGGSSTTNVIEAGVDEADLMKFDGEYLFTIEQPDQYYGWPCRVCVLDPVILDAGGGAIDGGVGEVGVGETVVDDAVVSEPDMGDVSKAGDSAMLANSILPYFPVQNLAPASIHVHQPTSQPAGAKWVSKLALSEAGMRPQGLYLSGSRQEASATLVSVSSSYNNGLYWGANYQWEGGSTAINFIDANDPSSLKEIHKLKWQGHYVDSRVVDNVLYVVSRHAPSINQFVYYPSSEDQIKKNEALIDDLDVQTLLPTLVIDGDTKTSLVKPENCLVPKSDDGDMWPSVITITAISLDNPNALPSSTCALATGAELYASTEALYLTQNVYKTVERTQTTRVHKFKLDDDGAVYFGSGEVDGTLGWRSMAFRMSDKDGYLRILTTDNSAGEMRHRLTILGETQLLDINNRATNTLKPVAVLPNKTHPQPIGKPGEDIFGVRFLGDRGYVVTFRRIDPLYILNLKNPLDPYLAGELEIPGVSEYLQVLDEDTLLGIGRSAENEVQVSLFDVADEQNPTLVSTTVAGSYSNAAYDYHAIAWVADANAGQMKLSFPVNKRAKDWKYYAQGLAFMTIDTKANTFTSEAFMPIFDNTNQQWQYGLGGAERVLIQGSALHYINEHLVWSASQGDLSDVVGPQGKWGRRLEFTKDLSNIKESARFVDDEQLSIDEDFLQLDFEASACSGNWRLFAESDFKESEPVQVMMKLNHETNPEVLCTQVIRPMTLYFDLRELKSRYLSQYSAESGEIKISFPGGATITYGF